MARSRSRRQKKNPALDSRKLVDNRLESPVLDWRSPPTVATLPNIEDLVKLDDASLHEVLRRFGIVQTWTEAEQAAQKYVQRISSRKWTRDELRAEARRISEVDTAKKTGTTRAARQAAKRAYREYTMHHAIGGDDIRKVEWIWIGEGGESSCDNCLQRMGTIGTLPEIAAEGMPEEVCQGGDDCNCMVMRLD